MVHFRGLAFPAARNQDVEHSKHDVGRKAGPEAVWSITEGPHGILRLIFMSWGFAEVEPILKTCVRG